MRLTPNPSSGSFTISTSAFSKPINFTILDAIGQVIDKITLTSSSTIYENINLQSGVYFYRTTSVDAFGSVVVTNRGKFLVVK